MENFAGEETYFGENVIESASFLSVDDHFMASMMKTSVFTDMSEVLSMEVEVELFLLDDSSQIVFYRFQNEEEERAKHL